MNADALRAQLLAWYDANARDLPWRVRPKARAAGVRADPYRVWLSEVMLQQTTVPHATPYFLNSSHAGRPSPSSRPRRTAR